jgi:hypothetical protein
MYLPSPRIQTWPSTAVGTTGPCTHFIPQLLQDNVITASADPWILNSAGMWRRANWHTVTIKTQISSENSKICHSIWARTLENAAVISNFTLSIFQKFYKWGRQRKKGIKESRNKWKRKKLIWFHSRENKFLAPHRDSIAAGRSGDRIPVGGEIFRTSPERNWSPLSLPSTPTHPVFPEGKAAGTWRWPPTPI